MHAFGKGGTGIRWWRLAVGAGVAVVGLGLPRTAAHAGYLIDEYQARHGADTEAMALGSDGNIWFTEQPTKKVFGQIGRITPTGNIKSYAVGPPGSDPIGITAGPDGNLWFTDSGTNEIGRITTAGVVTEFPVISANATLRGISSGAGKLWFSEYGAHKIGSITTSGTVTEYSLSGGVTDPNRIAAGPDGNMWFTSGEWIGQITPTGSVTPFFVNSTADVQGICAGSDGNLWFTDPGNHAIGRIATSGTVSEFALPAGSSPAVITPGPDGALWFTDALGNEIGQMSTSGTLVDESAVPTADSLPTAVTPGSDGNIWFSEFLTSKIGKLMTPNFNLLDIAYIPNRFFIPNIARPGNQGETVSWLSLNPGLHSIVDRSGLGLFGYSPSGGPIPIGIGQTFSFRFDWAGTYKFGDPYEQGARGRVEVPIVAAPLPGSTDTAQVAWASGDAPGGYAFHVQILVPGNSEFTDWQSGTTALAAQFGPASPGWVGAGTYQFRAALIDLATGATSAFSPSAAVALG
jgi:streptogramin lyase